MRSVYKFLTICTVVSILVCAFCVFSSAAGGYMPVCNVYPTAEDLPFGKNTAVICQTDSNEQVFRYYFVFCPVQYSDNVGTPSLSGVDFGEAFISSISTSSGGQGSLLSIILSSSRLIITQTTTDGGESWSAGSVGTIRHSGTTPDYTFYTYKLDISLTSSKVIYITNPESFFGIDGYSGFEQVLSTVNSYYNLGSTFNKHWTHYNLVTYPDSVQSAIQSILDYLQSIKADTTVINQHLTQYYNALDTKLDDIKSDVSALRGEVSSQAQQQSNDVSSAAAQNSQVVSQAADDILNAGDGSTVNNDMSEAQGIVSKLNEWNSQLDSFGDSMSDSITGVSAALDRGNTLFTKIVSGAPAGLAALLVFTLAWFVVRKILGR